MQYVTGILDPSPTRLLLEWSKGDHAALDELPPYVYRELHGLDNHLFPKVQLNPVLVP